MRDTLGLTYDVSFELSLFDRLAPGWFVVNVTSTPQKIQVCPPVPAAGALNMSTWLLCTRLQTC